MEVSGRNGENKRTGVTLIRIGMAGRLRMGNFRRGLDPFWMKARFNSTCAKCKGVIKRLENIFYYPNTKSALCYKCGEEAAAEFQCICDDEAFYNRGY